MLCRKCKSKIYTAQMQKNCVAEQKCFTGPRELKKNTTGTSVPETTCTIHIKLNLFTMNRFTQNIKEGTMSPQSTHNIFHSQYPVL